MSEIVVPEGKKIWFSKTLWINFILTFVIYFLPESAREMVTPENLAGVFMVVNTILRLVTKEKVMLF